jgi:hypothetical protein
MAKLNKIMPPRNTKIRGQDHLLAYITPEEAALLMANGGTGEAGPMGIPSYPEPGMGGDSDDRDGSGNSGGGGSSGGGGGGSSDDGDGGGGGGGGGMNEGQDNTGIADAAGYGAPSGPSGGGGYDTIGRAAEKDYGAPEPSAQDIEAARGFDFGSEASDALAASFGQGFNQMGAGLGYNVSGLELDKAFGQLDERMARAENLPGLLGVMANLNLSNIRSGLQKGYAPAFDKAGNIQGAFGPDPFGFGGLVYSGNPIEGNKATGWSDVDGGDGYDSRDPVKPVDPETGQCDEGYMFDEDMQACRLDTRSSMGGQPALPQVPFQPGGYARMGLLDEAPINLPQFQQRYGAGFGTPSEFAAANTAFRQQGAYRPEYFKRPYPTDGYTLLG